MIPACIVYICLNGETHHTQYCFNFAPIGEVYLLLELPVVCYRLTGKVYTVYNIILQIDNIDTCIIIVEMWSRGSKHCFLNLFVYHSIVIM